MARRQERAAGSGGWLPWLGFALLPLAVPPAVAPGGCPSACYCVATPELVQCRYERLEEPPRELPVTVHNLSIVGSNLSVLRPAAFAARPLPDLRLLRLRHNNIQTIEDMALLAAPLEEQLAPALRNLSLRRLELAGNGLRELDLRNNSLQRLAAAELRSLEAPGLRGLRLTLGANPLSCDCALRPFLAWLRAAAARVPDARGLRCAGPPPLRGATLLRLRPEGLACAAAEGGEPGRLETASYVFFGIVLALIGIVFLMVLYLNRRGIKRWLHNLRERPTRAPPASPASTRHAAPRRLRSRHPPRPSPVPIPLPWHRQKLVSEDEPASGMGAGVLQSGVHPPRGALDRLSLPVP
uniref:LRRCT domain-containing protein n=1 Tax=Aquila chrysaetos chrysaetos TaxID=223781 RepID=A0A663EQB2_AQUCH